MGACIMYRNNKVANIENKIMAVCQICRKSCINVYDANIHDANIKSIIFLFTHSCQCSRCGNEITRTIDKDGISTNVTNCKICSEKQNHVYNPNISQTSSMQHNPFLRYYI